MQLVNAKLLKSWLDSEKVTLIDVREPAEFSSTHIAGAKLIPLGKITKSALPKTENKVVIYCQKGMRGQSACSKLNDSEAQIFNLEGGIVAWQEAGYQTISGDKKVFPLDRQVQLTIGGSVFIGSVLTALVNAQFVWIPMFFGAGLIFAGASGTCALAKVIAKAPWNQ